MVNFCESLVSRRMRNILAGHSWPEISWNFGVQLRPGHGFNHLLLNRYIEHPYVLQNDEYTGERIHERLTPSDVHSRTAMNTQLTPSDEALVIPLNWTSGQGKLTLAKNTFDSPALNFLTELWQKSLWWNCGVGQNEKYVGGRMRDWHSGEKLTLCTVERHCAHWALSTKHSAQWREAFEKAFASCSFPHSPRPSRPSKPPSTLSSSSAITTSNGDPRWARERSVNLCRFPKERGIADDSSWRD